jgi:hypothetical protein
MSEPKEMPITQHFDTGMRAAYEELRPEWAKVIAGEMSRETYEAIKKAVFEKHGI